MIKWWNTNPSNVRALLSFIFMTISRWFCSGTAFLFRLVKSWDYIAWFAHAFSIVHAYARVCVRVHSVCIVVYQLPDMQKKHACCWIQFVEWEYYCLWRTNVVSWMSMQCHMSRVCGPRPTAGRGYRHHQTASPLSTKSTPWWLIQLVYSSCAFHRYWH
jgi:hypothetical protein